MKQYNTMDGKTVVLELLDTAGQEEYASTIQQKFIRRGDGFILVYSITSRPSFNKLHELRDTIITTMDFDNPAMIICANKCDLEDQREVSKEEGEHIAAKFNCPFIEISAKNSINLEQSIELIIKQIKDRGL